MRDSDVQKPPGIAEAIDWLAALNLLGVERLDADAVDRTLGSVLKYGEDQEVIRAAGFEQLVHADDDAGMANGVFGVETGRARSSGRSRERSAAGCATAGVPVTPERAADSPMRSLWCGR